MDFLDDRREPGLSRTMTRLLRHCVERDEAEGGAYLVKLKKLQRDAFKNRGVIRDAMGRKDKRYELTPWGGILADKVQRVTLLEISPATVTRWRQQFMAHALTQANADEIALTRLTAEKRVVQYVAPGSSFAVVVNDRQKHALDKLGIWPKSRGVEARREVHTHYRPTQDSIICDGYQIYASGNVEPLRHPASIMLQVHAQWDNRKAMRILAGGFPCLRPHLPAQWDVEWLLDFAGKASDGERQCVAFLLEAYNSGNDWPALARERGSSLPHFSLARAATMLRGTGNWAMVVAWTEKPYLP